MVRKALMVSGRILLVFCGGIVLFVAVSVAPLDRSTPHDQPHYAAMMARIDSAVQLRVTEDSAALRVGFGKASITPHYPTATAGYVKRKGALFSGIRDSVFVRTLVFEQANNEVAVVSFDLLIVPPALYQRLANALPSIGFSINRVYLGATHTHNSVGQWDNHLVGEIYAGDFDQNLIDFISHQTLRSIQEASASKVEATVAYGNIGVPEAVTNRLIKEGPVDSLLHVVEISRSDGSRGMILSFTAHATCLASADLRLSRDYPGELVDLLESDGNTFAMFLAGAVGSHAPIRVKDGDQKIQKMGNLLFRAVQQADVRPVLNTGIQVQHIPLMLGSQQVKISPGWRVRSWLSTRLLGEQEVGLTMLRLGDLVMLGTPCDFSGMLTPPIYQQAEGSGMHTFVTSFNGGYIGYVTPDSLYDLNKYETQTMNWYGPGNGLYFQDCLTRMLQDLADN